MIGLESGNEASDTVREAWHAQGCPSEAELSAGSPPEELAMFDAQFGTELPGGDG